MVQIIVASVRFRDANIKLREFETWLILLILRLIIFSSIPLNTLVVYLREWPWEPGSLLIDTCLA